MFENTIKIHVIGKNIERFIQRLYSEKIELLNIKYINYKEIEIKINKSDLEHINKIKTIYKIEVTELLGINKIKYLIKKNIHVLISILISFIMIIFLSNVIFKVEVIHSSKELRELLINELEERGIKEKSLVKNYNQIQNIKKEILEKYKDKIEWLEIERSGVKYIVRVEERIITKENTENTPSNIVAKKDAIIKDIDAIKGEVVKNINDYVKKGDTIITGEIKLYDEVKQNVKALGNVYGEVWYQASIEYPMNYYEEKTTGNNKKILSITLLNKKIELFTIHKFETKKIKEQILYQNKLIPFKIAKEYQEETIIINENLNEEEAFNRAIQKVEEKINSNLNGKEKILNIKCLKKEVKDSTIILDLFISVLENITEVKNIEIGDINVGDNT